MTLATERACLVRLQEMDLALARMEEELPDDVRALGAEARGRVAEWLSRLAEGGVDLAQFSAAMQEISTLMDALSARLLLAPWEAPQPARLKS